MVRLLSCLLRRNSQVKERSAEERAQKIPHQHLLVRKVQPMSQKKTETASEKAAKKNNVNESEDESEQEKDADEEEPEEESTSGVPDKLSPSDSEFCKRFGTDLTPRKSHIRIMIGYQLIQVGAEDDDNED
ncbi:uncharacterized protein [Nicotiana sylvestris]|uniref:uncharacterized protein isoform X2 n=1 Tax=Nicotiana sylvestris TaxID=4096 RepID=UPI00388C95D4